MDNFEQVCRKIDWAKMAKARKTVKNLAEKKPQLKYLGVFLDALAESAVEVHGVKLSKVYPSAVTANLISIALEREKLSNKIAKSFFKAQDKNRNDNETQR